MKIKKSIQKNKRIITQYNARKKKLANDAMNKWIQ